MRRRNAFSVVEIVVTIGILSTLLAMYFTFSSNLNTNIQPSLTDRASVQLESVRNANILFSNIREGLDVVRPKLAETVPFLVMKDLCNRICTLYLEPDDKNTQICEKQLYKLISYTSDYSGTFKSDLKKVLFSSVKSIAFTLTSPNKVQVDMTIANKKCDFRLISEVGLLNYGDTE
ncbi:MAG: hypothetical protein HQM10_15470 [Candidatus Riflebacteria bacterium]|nr:hypothetical protein [Candidatus Riflebacteria bacterium]